MKEKPVVVIVGAGFGGLRAARTLDRSPVQVILLDRRNYHLFQPLLYQVATAGVTTTDIAHPVRAIFRQQANLEYRMVEVGGVNFERRQVETEAGPVDYDYLILAPGSVTNYFGIQAVKDHGFGLKDLDEAVKIRNHILKMFELAEQEPDPEARRALLTFAVVGGGPTGVECAGAISELIRLALAKDYPNIDLQQVRVLLLEALESILLGFPPKLQRQAEVTLHRKHVEVNYQAMVVDYDGEQIELKGGEQIPARTLIWSAGVQAPVLAGKLGVQQARQGRIVVRDTLQLPDWPEVFVIGDAAYLEDANGDPLPMMAPVAIQQGERAARNIRQLIDGGAVQDFVYKDPGSLATIGRNAAVARIKNMQFSGWFAWIIWLVVHLFWLIGFRNRLLVLINWAWDYLFYERAVRLITPHEACE